MNATRLLVGINRCGTMQALPRADFAVNEETAEPRCFTACIMLQSREVAGQVVPRALSRLRSSRLSSLYDWASAPKAALQRPLHCSRMYCLMPPPPPPFFFSFFFTSLRCRRRLCGGSPEAFFMRILSNLTRRVSFESMKQLVLHKVGIKTKCNTRFQQKKDGIYTDIIDKKIEFTADKREKHGNTSYPYGYKGIKRNYLSVCND